MDYRSDGFIENIYIVGNMLTIQKGKPGHFGVNMQTFTANNGNMGTAYTYSKACNKITKTTKDVDMQAYFRIRAMANLETRKPPWLVGAYVL
jgi:predicted 3-demethylubiquinone-9 3-methyltransferase (glyoxalase superfamily)